MPERARGTLGAATVVVKVAVVAHLDRLPGDRFAGEVKGPRTPRTKVSKQTFVLVFLKVKDKSRSFAIRL